MGRIEIPALRRRLLGWYAAEHRDLPWRRTTDPYRVWVAEIMLQQTRVAAVLNHYRKFLACFPDVQTLARARLNSVLAAWSGLGYYRRARAMHACAREICRRHEGSFPQDAEALRKLPGIGRYTAAAIASIAFGQPCALVDGNVQRVLARLLGNHASQRELWACADALLSRSRPGEFNQAMMELGATVCLPKSPACGVCPLQRWCATRGRLPGRPAAPRRKQTVFYVLAIERGRVFLIQRAPDAALMPGMWELPSAFAGTSQEVLLKTTHSITSTDFRVVVVRASPNGASGRWIAAARLPEMPLTGLARKILRACGVINIPVEEK